MESWLNQTYLDNHKYEGCKCQGMPGQPGKQGKPGSPGAKGKNEMPYHVQIGFCVFVRQ